MKKDTALDALFLPFAQGLLKFTEGRTLFLRAREGMALQAARALAPICVQPFKPWADALERAGFDTRPHLPEGGDFAQVLLLPPRQREETRALLAAAFDACAPGGRVVASVPNDEGAKAIEGDFKKLAGGLAGQLGKYHCRVFWAQRDEARLDAELLRQWRMADAPRAIGEEGFQSRPGVFAWNRIDAGSALLAAHLQQGITGRAADLGAGWGFLAAALLDKNPDLRALDIFEADARALALAEANLREHTTGTRLGFHWHDVTAGLPAGAKYDLIVSNPPFHDTGKAAQPGIGQAFIRAAADQLAPHGALWLVANAHLPYEALLGERFASLQVVAAAQGYKVIECRQVRR